MKTAKILVIGSINMDLVTEVPHMPLPGETIHSSGFHMIPGGKGMNQAVAARRMDAHVTFIGRVGGDIYGQALMQQFDGEQIDRSHVTVDKGASSGLAFINVDSSGENSIVLHSGANGRVNKSDIDHHKGILQEADLVVLQLEIPKPVVEYTVKLCKRLGVPVLLNPAPAITLTAEVFTGLDYIVLNEIEGEQMTGVPASSPKKILSELHQMGVKNAILTLGADGVYFSEGGNMSKLPSRKVEVVDTTAAGDTFVGTFAVFISEGFSFSEAVQKGIDAASKTVGKLGAQSSIPKRDEIFF